MGGDDGEGVQQLPHGLHVPELVAAEGDELGEETLEDGQGWLEGSQKQGHPLPLQPQAPLRPAHPRPLAQHLHWESVEYAIGGCWGLEATPMRLSSGRYSSLAKMRMRAASYLSSSVRSGKRDS